MVDEEKIPKGSSRDDIIDMLNSANVPCYSGSCSEVYKEKAFENTTLRPKNDLVNAKKLGRTSLMFLVHPTLTDNEMKTKTSLLKQVFDTIDDKKLTEN